MRLLLTAILGTLLGSCALSTNGQNTEAEEEAQRTAQFTYLQTSLRPLELTVNFPPDWAETDARSAIVFFFGGGWRYSAVDHFERQAEYFASRGMVAIRPDFRVIDRDGTTPAESVRDAQRAVRWVRNHADSLGIHPNRIVVSGGSSGGHLAACTAHCPDPDNSEEP